MKLGPGLDLIENVSLTGIVDVYDMKGLRVARAWPRHPTQPRTEKQLAHWAKVRACMVWRHALPGWWISWWKTINTPKGYSWDDALRRSWWRFGWLRYQSLPATRPHCFGWTRGPLNLHLPPGLYVNCGDFGPSTFMLLNGWFCPVERDQVPYLKWTQSGYKCYPGRKKTPQYELDFSDYTEYVGFYTSLFPYGWNLYLGDIPARPYCLIGLSSLGGPRYKKRTLWRPGVVYNDWPVI